MRPIQITDAIEIIKGDQHVAVTNWNITRHVLSLIRTTQLAVEAAEDQAGVVTAKSK
jgi:hypothetical protein